MSPKASAQEVCDPDGVSVGYGVAFSLGPPPGYRIANVVVSDIAPACQDVELSVFLETDGSEVAREGPAVVNDTSMSLSFDPAPLASEITAVGVELDDLTVVIDLPVVDEPTTVPDAAPTQAPSAVPTTTTGPTPASTAAPTQAPAATPAEVVAAESEAEDTPVAEVQAAVDTPTPTPSPSPTPTATATATTEPADDTGDRPEIVRRLPSINDLDFSPKSLLTNAGLSSLLLAIVLIDTTIFNSILKENSELIHAFLWRWFAPFRGLIRRSDKLFGHGTGHGQELAIRPLLVLGLSGFAYSLLDPGFGWNTPTLVLFLSLVLGLAVATYVNDGGQVFVAEKQFQIPFMIQFFPAAIAIALVSVVVSRVGDIVPGIIFGFVASSMEASSIRPTARQDGIINYLPMVALLAVSCAAWLAIGPARSLDAGVWGAIIEAALAMIFIGSIQGLLFTLIPLKFLDGLVVWNWSKCAWLSIALPVAFLFFFVVLNDGSSLSTASSSHGVIALYATAIFAWVLTVVVWLYFRSVNKTWGVEEAEEDLENTRR
jgi:hypothetical protein